MRFICVGALVLAALLAPACAQNLTAINQAALDRHNQRRATHGADPLVWDAELAAYAVNYAAACNFRHEPNLRTLQQGENLAVTTETANETAVMLDMVDSWWVCRKGGLNPFCTVSFPWPRVPWFTRASILSIVKPQPDFASPPLCRYNEVSLYDFSNPANGPPNYMRHGHFTQVTRPTMLLPNPCLPELQWQLFHACQLPSTLPMDSCLHAHRAAEHAHNSTTSSRAAQFAAATVD